MTAFITMLKPIIYLLFTVLIGLM